jgi:hypothetical protein
MWSGMKKKSPNLLLVHLNPSTNVIHSSSCGNPVYPHFLGPLFLHPLDGNSATAPSNSSPISPVFFCFLRVGV